MPLSESDTRAKLIDPAIHAQSWSEDRIRRDADPLTYPENAINPGGCGPVCIGRLRCKAREVQH
jgi:hypothetical protein